MSEATTGTDLIVLPETGEVITRDSSDADLARAIDWLRDLKRRANTAQRDVEAIALERMDQACRWTRPAGDLTMTASSPEPAYEWTDKGADLRNTLDQMVGEGLITEEAANEACLVELAYKPRAAGVNAIRKRGPEFAARIDACRVEVDKPRYVTVRRHG